MSPSYPGNRVQYSRVIQVTGRGVPRVAFALSSLPIARCSVRELLDGQVGVSGSISSTLLIAEGLAARGHDVGILVLNGQVVCETSARVFNGVSNARAWLGDEGRVVLSSWGDERSLETLNEGGVAPLLWLHVHLNLQHLDWLERHRVSGIFVVSDSVRLPFLHVEGSRGVGRIYNPLHPIFLRSLDNAPDRYRRQRAVFAGFIGTRGPSDVSAQRVLELWQRLRAELPNATLTIAGSAKLYESGRRLGPFGVANLEFENAYLVPLAERFGGLAGAGIEAPGLLTQSALRQLYMCSSLGFVNFNWDTFTETFCSAGTEMLASGLPVFSFATGALPETLGPTGGALLCGKPDLGDAATAATALLRDPDRLETMGACGRSYVAQHYALDHVLSRWEEMLATPPERFHHVSGAWRGPRTYRYYVARSAVALRLTRALTIALAVARRMKTRRLHQTGGSSVV
jgi:glycosyltransferase involved in cell wall biosynthesis